MKCEESLVAEEICGFMLDEEIFAYQVNRVHSMPKDLYIAEVRFYNPGCKCKDAENRCFETAGGTSYVSGEMALKSALCEAHERICSMKFTSDAVRTFAQMTKENNSIMPVFPEDILPLSPEQRRKNGIIQVTSNIPIGWRFGEKYITSGYYMPIFIPSDLVYYGHHVDDTPYVAKTNSSGVATHVDRDAAKRLALLELIERDAIMRFWYDPAPMACRYELQHPINAKIHDVMKKVDFFAKKYDSKLEVLSLSSDYAKVFLTIITSDHYPYFTCGAAATFDDVGNAILKSVAEAELNYHVLLGQKHFRKIKARQVVTPWHHALLYAQNNFNKYITAKIKTDEYVSFEGAETIDVDKVIEVLQPIVVDISAKESILATVRVLSSKLVPITFGYGMDLKHKQIAQYLSDVPYIGGLFGYSLPHFFA